MTEPKRKLIEVALPLEAINRESAREKSIRHGHPSTLHLWWARRPLAACRAVLFSQLVDDPSAHPDRFPTSEAQEIERKRLFALLEELVKWENVGNESLLRKARAEIAASTDGHPPPILDPFAGGGSIPLEAQRLGLEAHASDLNPVAVLINKALIEIPPRWAGQPPVYPGVADDSRRLDLSKARETDFEDWPRATGLAEDVRRYGEWMRDQAKQRIGHLYPKATLPDGSQANVIAWIWARTVTCPNPACRAAIPLMRSFWLSKKKARPTWLEPVVEGDTVRFDVHTGKGAPTHDGTVGRSGAECVACRTPVDLSYVRVEGKAGRMRAQLVCTVAEGNRQRIYLAATDSQVTAANVPRPHGMPEIELSTHPQYMGTPRYGLTTFADLFTNRQLVALTTLSDAVIEARDRVEADAKEAGLPPDDAITYAKAIATYLAFAVSKLADFENSLAQWRPDAGKEQVGHLFARQAIPMVWDYCEASPFTRAAGGWDQTLRFIPKAVERLGFGTSGIVHQADAATLVYPPGTVVSTDPPYYDNVPYADLSDFFYVWLRRSLGPISGDTVTTVLTPKAQELVADTFRFEGSRQRAHKFFESGMRATFTRVRESQDGTYPVTIFYAFKQSEHNERGISSSGWDTMLTGLLDAGFSVTATWPVRSELGNRIRSLASNALASSVVLACRPRSETAVATTRRGFLAALRAELPRALRELRQGSIAPVDLAQAAIGPGMAVFSRYSRVVEADGSDMTVRTALALINHALDEVLTEAEGDLDSDTRFCVQWFAQHGWKEGPSGEADVLARATNTSIAGLHRGGVFRAVAGKARLLAPAELDPNWDPVTDDRTSAWEAVVHLAHTLATEGGPATAALLTRVGRRMDADAVKGLAYRLYDVCEKKGWTESALLFNGLGSSWLDLESAARQAPPTAPVQGSFALDEEA